jgi:hypothetical protein
MTNISRRNANNITSSSVTVAKAHGWWLVNRLDMGCLPISPVRDRTCSPRLGFRDVHNVGGLHIEAWSRGTFENLLSPRLNPFMFSNVNIMLKASC